MRIRTLRWLLCLATLAVVIGAARSASADGPFCDLSASTNFAPPPLMPIRDVRFEVDTAPLFMEWCQRVLAQLTPVERNHVPKRLSPNALTSAPDAGVISDKTLLPRRRRATRVGSAHTRSKGPSGFRSSVYRPPR
jgi:hypothetical protein